MTDEVLSMITISELAEVLDRALEAAKIPIMVKGPDATEIAREYIGYHVAPFRGLLPRWELARYLAQNTSRKINNPTEGTNP